MVTHALLPERLDNGMTSARRKPVNAALLPTPTLEDVRSWGATVGIPQSNTVFGLSDSYGYELAKRGDYPARVIKVGGRYRVVTSSILRVLSDEVA